jgi:hypothetical protein
VIRDRDLPIAKLVPLTSSDVSAEERVLAARGELVLPAEVLNERAFWSIGASRPMRPETAESLAAAVSQDREERDAGLLGR